jgi:hypothetical protein
MVNDKIDYLFSYTLPIKREFSSLSPILVSFKPFN